MYVIKDDTVLLCPMLIWLELWALAESGRICIDLELMLNPDRNPDAVSGVWTCMDGDSYTLTE